MLICMESRESPGNKFYILNNSKELLEYLKSPNFNHITSIKTFDFSTLYTTIPHDKLKSRLASIIRNSFIFKNGNRRYKYLVLGHEEAYFVKEHADSKNKYSEDDIIKILEFLVDNIFVVFAGKVFQQIVGIPMGTNCAPLLVDIFLYSYEAEFRQSLLSTGRKQLASRFNFTYRYIDDVLSINNPEFENYLGQMNSRSKTRQRATLLLLTWIYFCRSEGTVNFAFPFMTNVTSSISTSHIFRSWVEIFQPRPPTTSLFRSLYDLPGLAPRMDVLFRVRGDFQISFSNRDTSRNAWNRHWGSFMVDTGILSNKMKFPSQKC